jgi:hypothetical protein
VDGARRWAEREREQVADLERRRHRKVVAQPGWCAFAQTRGRVRLHDLSDVAHELGDGMADYAGLPNEEGERRGCAEPTVSFKSAFGV